MSEMITKENEKVKRFLSLIIVMSDKIERMATNYRPTLNGEQYLTDGEVSKRLKISRRTLQEYRNKGKIGYVQLAGKVLYRESDIQKWLDENYQKKW